MTAGSTDLIALLDALDECHLAVARIPIGGVAAGRELVGLRRVLSLRAAAMAEALDRYLAPLDPEVRQEGRRRLADMRAAAALHQAEWPAVRLLDDPAAYRVSAERVRERHRAFDRWLRAHLAAQAPDPLPRKH